MKSQTALDPQPTVLDGTVGKIAYAQAGTEGPCLILVHGCPGSRWDFRWWLSELSQWARVIVVDMPGYGDATPTQFPATTAGRTAYLSEVLDTLDIDKAFVVGHSFGATAVVDFALRYPERVKAIALLAPIGHSCPVDSGSLVMWAWHWPSKGFCERRPERASIIVSK